MATKINKEKEKKEKKEMSERISKRRAATTGSKKIHDDDIERLEIMRRIEKRKKPEVTTYSKDIDVSKKCGDKTLFNISFNYKTRLSGKKLFPLTDSNFEKKEKNITEKIDVGDIVKYIPRDKTDKNFGLEAKVLKISELNGKKTYNIEFTNPILGNLTKLKDLNEYEEYLEEEKGEKKEEKKEEKMINHKQLVKITKMNLFFCEDEEIDNKETIGDKINEHVQNFVNKKFIPYEFPTKIINSGNSWFVEFLIPQNAVAGSTSTIQINNETVGVDIPDKFKPYQYHKIEIKDTLQGSINAKRKRIEMEEKIEKVLFIPSYIKASEYDGESKILDLDVLVEPGPNQLYVIKGVKIIKNKETGNNYEIADNVSLSDKSKIKNIKVNLELFLILKSKKPEGESRKDELKRKIHDMIMNNGTCDDAMANLRKAVDKAADVTPDMSRKTEEELYFKAKRDKDGNVIYGPQTKNETKKAKRKLLDSKVSYSQIEESGAQTRKRIKEGVGRLKSTDNLERDKKRRDRRLNKDKQFARDGQEKPPVRPKRRRTKTAPTRPPRRPYTLKPSASQLKSAKGKLKDVKSVGNPIGGKRTRKKRRRKKNTRRKKRNRKKTRRKKKKRKKTRRK
tara:strand:- start:9473 stop:11335 length:1863 start_codon:yes stop_codon:yes gene_type:complete